MSRPSLDEGWGLVGAGVLGARAADRHFPKLGADEIQDALAELLEGPELEAGRIALLTAWQRAAHVGAWWASKATPGESFRTLREIDRHFEKGRDSQARELLERVNELTALHIEVRSEGHVDFGAKGRREFTPFEMQRIRRAVRSIVTDPPSEFRAPKRGARPKVFSRLFRDELAACLSFLGPERVGRVARRAYNRLGAMARLAFVLRPLRDLERLERGRKAARKPTAPPSSVRRHKLR